MFVRWTSTCNKFSSCRTSQLLRCSQRSRLSLQATALLAVTSPSSLIAPVIAFSTSSTSSTIIPSKAMPSLPLQYESAQVLDLEDFSQDIQKTEDRRQEAFDLSRQLQKLVVSARTHAGQTNATLPLRDFLKQPDTVALLGLPHEDSTANTDPRQPRLANLSSRIEDMVRLEAFQHFLETGHLVPLSSLTDIYHCTDEEYLSGACMGLCQDLERYGLGRATVRDVDSVQAATALVADIQEFLLQMDFRNGPLRRKFDGNKYRLKGLETLQYELAITGNSDSFPNEPESKKLKREELVPTTELEQLQKRMEHRDELRESLIKKCRDSQKAAKQSIFALHRGDTTRTKQLLEQCRDAVQRDLLPLVQEEVPLRYSGSYTGVLEEYVEGRLFAAWLHGDEFFGVKKEETNTEDTAMETSIDSAKPVGLLLKPQDFQEVSLQPEEYLGGLCDLTGEIGRYAVQRGTARDVESVRLCLQTNSAILTALQTLGRLPSGSISKKMEAVRRSVEKLERMLYEMSLSEAAGGRNVKSDTDAAKEETNET